MFGLTDCGLLPSFTFSNQASESKCIAGSGIVDMETKHWFYAAALSTNPLLVCDCSLSITPQLPFTESNVYFNLNEFHRSVFCHQENCAALCSSTCGKTCMHLWILKLFHKEKKTGESILYAHTSHSRKVSYSQYDLMTSFV